MTFDITRRAAALALPALFLGTAAAAPLSVRHAGGAASLPAAPRRAVVYDLGALDALHALGVPASAVAGVPRAQLPRYLDSFAQRPAAGGLFEPDYEALSRLAPDLIIVGGRSAGKAEVLGRIAPTLDLSVSGKHMLADIERNIATLALLFGRQAQGRALVQRIHAELQGLRAQASQAAPGLLLMAVNDKLLPQAPGSRFGFLFDVFGARSALSAAQLPARGTAYGFDDVARLDPEWIYVIDRNTATGQAAGGGEIMASRKVFDNARIHATAAGRKGQVVFLDPKGWYLMGSAGPTALLDNMAQLRQAYGAASSR